MGEVIDAAGNCCWEWGCLEKNFLLATSIVLALTVFSCGRAGDKIEPVRTEVIDFDIETANRMIEDRDKIIADITVRDSVSREEFDQFLHDAHIAYDGFEDADWAYMFFYNEEFEDETIQVLYLNEDVFYPTVYHQGVEVVSARVENTYYEDGFFDTSNLIIREAYVGEDRKLEDWYRESVYQKNDKGKWVFHVFDGRVNLGGEGFTRDYLELKE